MKGTEESSGKKIRVSLYIEEETKKKAALLAAKESRSLNNYIQRLLEREIAKDENATNQRVSAA